MAGNFELVTDHDGNCLVRLVDGRGEEIAVSVPFTSSSAAIDGINSFREVAATAPIRDHTSSAYRRRVEQHEQAAPHHDRKVPLGQSRRLRHHGRH
ncbi:YegP family protein [Arthrobacter sedimenti]|uniref:YegP family protein n=1 Tax=Arthrobacter sedimenti TaxID=2694931 RepID=A0ABV8WGI3_9MICC